MLLVLCLSIIGFTTYYLISSKVWVNDTRIIGVENNIKSILLTLIATCQVLVISNIILNSTSPLSLESFDYPLIVNFLLIAMMSIVEILLSKRYSKQKYGSKPKKSSDRIGAAIGLLGFITVLIADSNFVVLILPVCYIFILSYIKV